MSSTPEQVPWTSRSVCRKLIWAVQKRKSIVERLCGERGGVRGCRVIGWEHIEMSKMAELIMR